MNKSETIKELSSALSKAQGLIEGATKDKLNPHYKSRYADLASVVDAIRKPLADNGLSYTQIIHDATDAVKVETIILHASGEWFSCGTLTVPVNVANAQGYGSALTYARRYSLSAAFGVAPSEDDGEAAAAAAPRQEQPVKPDPEGKAALEECGSLAALAATWKALTPAQRRTLAETKDQCKARIEKADAETATA